MKKQLLTGLIVLFAGYFAVARQSMQEDTLILSRPLFDSVNGKASIGSFTLRFNRFDKRNQLLKKALKDPAKINIRVEEYIGSRKEKAPEYIAGSLVTIRDKEGKPIIPAGITVSILIDKSGTIQAELPNIRAAVKTFVEQLPEGSVFFSTFHNIVSTSIPINNKTFETADFNPPYYETDLYNAILIKLHEFDRFQVNENAVLEPGYSKEPGIAERAEKDTINNNNYLIVLTDGTNDIGKVPKYSENPLYQKITEEILLREIGRYRNRVKIYTIGYGANSGNYDQEILRKICTESGNSRGFIPGKPDSINKIFNQNLIADLAIEYQARFKNPPKTFCGEERKLIIKLINSESLDTIAAGGVAYTLGSSYKCVRSGVADSTGQTLFTGFLAGIILLLLVLIVIQLIYPLIKNKIFQIRYNKRYKPAPNEKKKVCPFCFDEIRPRDKIVAKCEHIVHKDCWAKCGYMCPEFGQNCTTGKQEYFDLQDPFSTKNKTFYLTWVLYGLVGGLLSWLIYIFVKDSGMLDGFSGKMVGWFARDNIDSLARENFIYKIAPSLIVGMLMGFLLCSFFAFAEEYRRLSWPVTGRILLRGGIGALLGFISFFIGNIFVLLLNAQSRNIWIDSIPWLIFGAAIGYSLSVKTTIHWKHGLLGGLISVLFSFLAWYGMSPDLESVIAMVICFMLYGAGLGFSIATVRSTAEQYFVKIVTGAKQGNLIAVHKWMSSQGGLNEVFIGIANACEIQMNWEKAQNVGDKHAKLYFNNARKMPVLVSLHKEYPTFYDERIEMTTGKEYDLINGITFKIGETIFQYIEKDIQP